MSTPRPQLAGRVGGDYPSALGRRVRERLLLGAGVLGTLVLALAISIEMPRPSVASLVLVVGILAGVVAVLALMLSTRYAITLTLLTLYLGLLDGPVKLESASKLASGVRDVLILAIGLGMLMHRQLKRERVSMPPLSGWVLAFVAVVLVEALNPHTNGVLKVIGGYRQALEFVPLFFFGYLIMRSKQRFRQLFLLLGVIALANGVVGAYQARLSPGQLASWGPGYGERIKGNGRGVTGRTYAVEGVVHPRPPALGSDSGFGGGVGTLALPGLLALLAAGRTRRRWLVLLCCMGAVLGIATSASRTSIIIAVVTLAPVRRAIGDRRAAGGPSARGARGDHDPCGRGRVRRSSQPTAARSSPARKASRTSNRAVKKAATPRKSVSAKSHEISWTPRSASGSGSPGSAVWLRWA